MDQKVSLEGKLKKKHTELNENENMIYQNLWSIAKVKRKLKTLNASIRNRKEGFKPTEIPTSRTKKS